MIYFVTGGQQVGGYGQQGPREMFIMQQQGQQVQFILCLLLFQCSESFRSKLLRNVILNH